MNHSLTGDSSICSHIGDFLEVGKIYPAMCVVSLYIQQHYEGGVGNVHCSTVSKAVQFWFAG